jgi:signal recognition particle subunit SRP54
MVHQQRYEFTLVDFRKILAQTTKASPLRKFMNMLLGRGDILQRVKCQGSHREIRRLVGIIDAMTPEERCRPNSIIDNNRCRRISIGAGVTSKEVETLVKQFTSLSSIHTRILSMSLLERVKWMRGMRKKHLDESGNG